MAALTDCCVSHVNRIVISCNQDQAPEEAMQGAAAGQQVCTAQYVLSACIGVYYAV
jgi:hypothetical protein